MKQKKILSTKMKSWQTLGTKIEFWPSINKCKTS